MNNKYEMFRGKEILRRDYPNFTSESANMLIQKQLILLMKGLIEKASKSDFNLNEYFKQVVNPSIPNMLK